MKGVGKRLRIEEKEHAFALKALGRTQRDIAEVLEVSESCISRLFKEGKEKPEAIALPPPTVNPYAGWKIDPHMVRGRVVISWPEKDIEPMLAKLPLHPGQIERLAAKRAEAQDPDSA